jgi:hypothetical protein
MRKATRLSLLVFGLLFAATASGYEIATHALMTFGAYKRARLGADPTLLANLGLLDDPSLSISTQRPLGDKSLDVLGSQVRVRESKPYEFLAMPRIDDSSAGSGDGFRAIRDRTKVSGWLMAGAIREDDNPGEGPHDDPYVPNHDFHREFNHFFDPSRNRPLTINGLGAYYAVDANGITIVRRAPDWATGIDDAFVPLGLRGSDRLNHFTTLDAREAMWRALTLKQIDSAGILRDVPLTTIPGNSSAQALRNAYWATTFRALGDILHLNQDMAQPQHTRNEPHSGKGPFFLQTYATGHESTIEKYIDARARNLNAFDLQGKEVTPLAPLSFGDYGIPRFGHYSDYWSTGVPAGAPVDQPTSGFATGSGLADYSNRGFFSEAKNFGTHQYASPSSNLSDYTIENTTLSYPRYNGLVKTQYLRGSVPDFVTGMTDVIRMTTRGLFEDVGTTYGLAVESYTLDANVLDDQASLLIPRAIAYSAGLLDYFFRGELRISLPDEGAYAVVDHTEHQCPDTCGFSSVKLKLKNTSPSNESMSNGLFVAVAKFHRNGCYRPDLSGDPGGPAFASIICRSVEEEIYVSDPEAFTPFPPGVERTITFVFRQPIPINATDIYLQVVFRGQLGNETDAVVVATKNISEPNYIAYVNDRDYAYNDVNDTFQAVTTGPQTITDISMMLGSATTPVATLAQLPVRGYAQLAFLTDIPAMGTDKVTVYASVPVPGAPSIYDMPISTFDSPGGTLYERLPVNVFQYRGMWSDFRLDHFQGIYEVALCYTGDTRRICTSAGLSPITAANAVPWTINFP